ncbi:MAG TPA: RNA polymerase sigma factor [Anaerovoracaceae bacterium]|nr:RNA polymerase sigma factor [Anaerovoracaceae bacterium]
MNESQWILNIQSGDSDSFRELFELYKSKAVRTAYLITGNQATAEDVAQEAFVKCYFKIGELKDPECFKTWFYRLLIRTAWRYAETEKKNVPVQDVFEESKTAGEKSIEQQYLEAETSNILYKQVQKLDQKKRTAVMLFYYSELSTKEIAQVMGCLEGTVKSRLHFARKILKRNLEILQLKEDGYYGKAEYESGL